MRLIILIACFAISTATNVNPASAQTTLPGASTRQDLDTLVKPILDALKKNDAKAAVDAFVAGSPLMKGKSAELTNLQSQIQNTVAIYGPISDFDLAQEQTYGNSTVRRYYVAAHENLNTRWEFVFSRTAKGWVIAFMAFEDQQRTWFNRPS